MTDRCFICGEDNPVTIEHHHIIPRRYGGPDTGGNLVALCANCHRAIEAIYTDELIEELAERVTAAQATVEQSLASESHDQLATIDKLTLLYRRAADEGVLTYGQHYRIVHQGKPTEELRINISQAHNRVMDAIDPQHSLASLPMDEARGFYRDAHGVVGYVASYSRWTEDVGRCVGILTAIAGRNIESFDPEISVH